MQDEEVTAQDEGPDVPEVDGRPLRPELDASDERDAHEKDASPPLLELGVSKRRQ